ncbi:MAG: hypothetical protein WCP32_15145 [Bacteroidota bacterium]
MRKLSCLIIAAIFVLIFSQCSTELAEKIKIEPELRQTLEKQLYLQNLYNIAKYEWYEIFKQGYMSKASEAKKALDSAELMILNGKVGEANMMLDRAGALLSFYDTSYIKRYETQTPLLKPDLSKIRSTNVDDYEGAPISGVVKTDVGGGFWGYGDDSVFYAIMPLVNYHGAGKPVKPIVVDFISSIPGKNRVVYINSLPTITKTPNSISYYAVEGDKFMRLTIKKEGGKTVVFCEGRGDGISFNTEWHPTFAYWYNQNQGAGIGYPETGFSGTEEIGSGTGTFTVDGHTAKIANGAAELENLCDGALPGVNHKVDYRKQMTIYGNEFWISLHADQIDGQIILFGLFRDGALYYNNEYIVPTEIIFTPIEGGKSFILEAKTAKGDLIVRCDVQCWEPMFYEFGCTMKGTFAGKPLTNGYLWLEHTILGGVDCVALEDAGAKAPVKTK